MDVFSRTLGLEKTTLTFDSGGGFLTFQTYHSRGKVMQSSNRLLKQVPKQPWEIIPAFSSKRSEFCRCPYLAFEVEVSIYYGFHIFFQLSIYGSCKVRCGKQQTQFTTCILCFKKSTRTGLRQKYIF